MAENNFTGAGAGSYKQLDQDQQYDYDPGIVALPVAGADPAFKLIRLHGGMGRRVVSWQASRAGKPPIVPSMTDAGPDTFLGGGISVGLPAPDGQAAGYHWNVSGQYTFVQAVPRIVGQDTFAAGGFPFAVVPNDGLAASLAAAGDGAADLNEFGTLVGDAVIDHETNAYIWPFTILTPHFTNDNLLGG